MYMLSLVVFFSGSMVFIFSFKMFMVNLLSIEFMMLGIFSLFFYNSMFNNNFYFCVMILFGFLVSEGCLGLSLLMSMVRWLGNNYFYSLLLLKW